MKLNRSNPVFAFLIPLKVTFMEALDNKILKLSAALAYYTVFSLVPMLIIIIWISGIFYDTEIVQGQVLGQLRNMLGDKGVQQIREVMVNTKFDGASAWAKALGVVTLILSATGIFGEIQDSINMIWGLKTKPDKGFIQMVISRILSFSLIISLGFVLVVSLVMNAVIAAFTLKIQYYFPQVPVFLYYFINQGIIFIILCFLFAAIFKVLPDAKIRWKDVISSSVVTAVLFMLGKYVIGYYLGTNGTISAYGTAGSVIIILLWVYFSSIILYFGAEFTQASLKVKGKHIEPNKYAVWVEEKEQEVPSNTDLTEEKIPQ